MPRSHRHSRVVRLVAGASALIALVHLPASTASAEARFPQDEAAVSAAGLHSELLPLIAQGDPLENTQPAPLPAARAASAAPGTQKPPIVNSDLDARLFYQLLIGEVELREGEVGTAYEVLLDAARRAPDEQLFKHVTDVALQARAGEQALAAARAWRTALPESLDAHRYVVQILAALNRPAETVEPLRSLIKLTPENERPRLIAALPLFFGRGGLQGTPAAKAASLSAIEQVVQPYMEAPETRGAARTSLARAYMLSGDTARALKLAQEAHALDPQAERPVLLALELLPERAEAEPLITDYLERQPAPDPKTANTVRLVYARVLGATQRYADAARQLELVTSADPKQSAPWLTLGALYVDLKQPKDADRVLNTYIKLVQSEAAAPSPAASGNVADTGSDSDSDQDDAVSPRRDDRLTQAYLLLAQSAEQRNDLAGANNWLSKVDDPQRALDVQARRASLLAKEGKLQEGRDLIRRSPERTPEDARAKLLAEAQLMRDAKQWDAAAAVLAEASQRFPDDPDLIYEQAMIAEKQNRLDDMERMLRRVIELKPTYHHAYNALGYSLAERGLRLNEARDLIRKALDLAPGEPFITDSLGWVEYRLGNKEEALRLLREAYRARPDTEIGAHLGEVLWMSGKQDEARKIWSEARMRDSSNDVLKETLARLRVNL